MIQALNQWIKKNKAILSNSSSLMGTMLVTSPLGFAFWWLASKQFSADTVGLATTATSAMMLLTSICMMGFSTLLITELPRNPGQEGPLISVAVIIIGGASAVAGVLFALIAPYISPNLQGLGATPLDILLFTLGAVFASVTFILDQVTIALLKGGLQFWRNALFAISKLVILWMFGTWLQEKSAISVYTTWTIGNALSLLPLVFAVIKAKKWHPKHYLPKWDLLRKMGKDAIKHHILNLINQAPMQLLPLIVTVLLSQQESAGYYIASMIVNFVTTITTSLTMVLHATNAADTKALAEKSRLTIGLGTVTTIVASGALIIAGYPILHFFKPEYAEEATWCLRILAIAVLPTIITTHYLSICRIQDRIMEAVIPIILAAILDLVAAAAGAHYGGLTGVSLGWLIAMVIQAIYMSPLVIRTLRNTQPAVARPFVGVENVRNFFDDEPAAEPAISRSFLFLDMPTDTFTRIIIMEAPTRKMPVIAMDEQPQKFKKVHLTQSMRKMNIMQNEPLVGSQEGMIRFNTTSLPKINLKKHKAEKDEIAHLPTGTLEPLSESKTNTSSQELVAAQPVSATNNAKRAKLTGDISSQETLTIEPKMIHEIERISHIPTAQLDLAGGNIKKTGDISHLPTLQFELAHINNAQREMITHVPTAHLDLTGNSNAKRDEGPHIPTGHTNKRMSPQDEEPHKMSNKQKKINPASASPDKMYSDNTTSNKKMQTGSVEKENENEEIASNAFSSRDEEWWEDEEEQKHSTPPEAWEDDQEFDSNDPSSDAEGCWGDDDEQDDSSDPVNNDNDNGAENVQQWGDDNNARDRKKIEEWEEESDDDITMKYPSLPRGLTTTTKSPTRQQEERSLKSHNNSLTERNRLQ